MELWRDLASIRRAALALLLLLPAAALGQSGASRRPPTFGAGVEVIRLSLSVTDHRNRPVGGLTESDFAVFEDGIPQDLSFFAREPLPLSVALLVDCSGSMDEKLAAAQEAGARFVRTLRHGDRGQVVQFNDRRLVLQDFTDDLVTLETAIRSTRASGATALYTTLYVALKDLRAQGEPDSPRRRAIVLLSDGEDTASVVSDDQVLDVARRADVAVYAICLRPARPGDRERRAFAEATHFLTAHTRDSGGQVLFPGALSELDGAYDRIADELRSQYTVGYVPRSERRDGKWRRIVVQTPARDGLLVRHKPGYYPPRG